MQGTHIVLRFLFVQSIWCFQDYCLIMREHMAIQGHSVSDSKFKFIKQLKAK